MGSVEDAVRRRAARFRAFLADKLDEIVREGDVEVVNASRGDFTEKVDEDQAPLSEMQQVIASSRNSARARRVAEIRAAITRLEHDPESFGSCEDCDEPIEPRRMQLMPWVRLCLPCQEAAERVDGPRGRRHITDFK
jgi:DnaK suppressor protein